MSEWTDYLPQTDHGTSDEAFWLKAMDEQGIPRGGQHNLTDKVSRGSDTRAYYVLLPMARWREWLAWFVQRQSENPGR